MVHPSFNSRTMVNDVSLVFLSTCATLGDNVQVIPMATDQGEQGVVVGGSSTVRFFLRSA